jgi:hypothetical protein
MALKSSNHGLGKALPSRPRCRDTVVAAKRTDDFSSTASSFSMSILGDLHLPPSVDGQMDAFWFAARDQLKLDMSRFNPEAERVVQLGDLGAYDKGWPGSSGCFKLAKNFLDSFGVPTRLILGNHDLEDAALDTDAENLEAWRSVFGQNHYWTSQIGRVKFVGLSTVRFRSNAHSVHEVHIDDEQIEFLEEVLRESERDDAPVVLFTHAPILGSGLKAVQAVHVKNRCAWLNHSSNADHFIQLVRKHPNIKLWFSGHFHLSQSYPDSISVVGGSAFVLTGVIGGKMSRDGHRHSRILRGDDAGFEVLTMDHDTGDTRVDLSGSWDAQDTPVILTPPEELICDISSGFLCSEVDCTVEDKATDAEKKVEWFNISSTSMLHLQGNMLIEYNTPCMAPIGAVFLNVPDHCYVRLVDVDGKEVDAITTDGSTAIAVEMVDREAAEVVETVYRNPSGGFYNIFQPNKWVLAKEQQEKQRKTLVN